MEKWTPTYLPLHYSQMSYMACPFLVGLSYERPILGGNPKAHEILLKSAIKSAALFSEKRCFSVKSAVLFMELHFSLKSTALFTERHCAFHWKALCFSLKSTTLFMELCFSLKSIVLFIKSAALFMELHFSLKSIALFMKGAVLFMVSHFSLQSTVLFTEKQQNTRFNTDLSLWPGVS